MPEVELADGEVLEVELADGEVPEVELADPLAVGLLPAVSDGPWRTVTSATFQRPAT